MRISPFDYVQHKFRYFDGRFLSTLRGQRVTWALFNIALRESSHHIGSVVYKQCGQQVLTKAELTRLVTEREDLVRRITAFGAEIPTTPLFWKRQGNELEWIVRQMSWNPPWCPVNYQKKQPRAKRVLRQIAIHDEEEADNILAPSVHGSNASSDEQCTFLQRITKIWSNHSRDRVPAHPMWSKAIWAYPFVVRNPDSRCSQTPWRKQHQVQPTILPSGRQTGWRAVILTQRRPRVSLLYRQMTSRMISPNVSVLWVKPPNTLPLHFP